MNTLLLNQVDMFKLKKWVHEPIKDNKVGWGCVLSSEASEVAQPSKTPQEKKIKYLLCSWTSTEHPTSLKASTKQAYEEGLPTSW